MMQHITYHIRENIQHTTYNIQPPVPNALIQNRNDQINEHTVRVHSTYQRTYENVEGDDDDDDDVEGMWNVECGMWNVEELCD